MKNNLLERKARIFNTQKYNMYDGPGVRTIIFFQGCPLRCKWCANPEGLMKKNVVMYKKNSCTNCKDCVDLCPVNIHKVDSNGNHFVDRNISCIGCKKCEKECLNKALSIVGEEKNISELLKIVEEDRTFYEMSGGGVTLGGGEVFLQPEGAINLLMACKNAGINTAVETCGYTSLETIKKAANYVDLFLFDLKVMDSDRHYYWTGVRNEGILENLKYLLENKYNVEIRLPFIREVNDMDENIEKLIETLKPYGEYKNFKGIDILPYHRMGVNKYDQLDMKYEMEGEFSVPEERLLEVERILNGYNLKCKVIRH
ncbi:choline TMA-lyase-activating enzyme [Cetobacterium sp. SF1]|uniref:choline TMA-lyase-activating enzyme n=1 Tax=unclassified Cetobacterium TaxID=2630983 RepID=UPI003CF8AD63